METSSKSKQPVDGFYSIDIEADKEDSPNELTEINVHKAEPPDGGWGWVVTFSAFYINTIIMGTHNCFSILYYNLVEEFKESLSNTAWVGSIAFGCILIFAPLSACLSNRFGCRKISFLGIIIASVSLFVSAYATSITTLYFTYGFGYGIGTSLCYMQGAVMVARYFSTKRALASGMGLAGSTLGALILAPLYDFIMHSYGWKIALQVIAGMTATCLFGAATYRPLRKPGTSTHEERVKSSPARKFVLDLSLWKNKAFIVWAIAIALCKIGYLVPWVHMVKFATEEIKQKPIFGTRLLQYMGVAATFSRLFVGKIADSPHINRLFLSQFSACMMGVVNIVQAHIMSYTGLVTYAVLLGLLDGGVEILLPVMTLDLVGAEHLSIAWGCILAVISISSMGPPVAGAIFDSTGAYTWAFYFAGFPMIASALVLFLIPLWASNQNQNPSQSIISINPSHLELLAETTTTAICSRAAKVIHRLCRRKKKGTTESKGQLIAQLNTEQATDIELLEVSHGTNRQFPLPGIYDEVR